MRITRMTFVRVAVVVVVGLLLVWLGRCSVGEPRDGTPASTPVGGTAQPTLWTCPMHPEIQLPDPVPCPKCGMDLVPMDQGDDTLGPRQIALSPAAVVLAGIATSPVVRSYATMPVRLVGKVDFDETRVRTIAARVAGRLDRMYVDATGIPVEEGQHLVRLYSPALLEAQEELLGAKRRLAETAGEQSPFLMESNRAGYRAARERLVLWGLSDAQVDAIEARGTSEDHMLIRSPASGVVIHKALNQGDYVGEGTAIYRIADLSRLWVQFEAYEQDLAWLRYGQQVEVQVEALPGRLIDGEISFISPLLRETTRTAQVRVQLDNPDGSLKPGMFARGMVRVRIGEGGQVLATALAGKWISPMHPEIIKDGPGTCDVCGMDLVPAEELGYVTGAAGGADAPAKPLLVPASAVLLTGTRAVVYVEVPGAEEPTYEGREIVVGPRAGDEFVVRAGLEEHERVVTHGAFRIDSAMQIQARPSMMAMAGAGGSHTGLGAAVFRRSLTDVYAGYLAVQQSLAKDDGDGARQGLEALGSALDAVEAGGLRANGATIWREEKALLQQQVAALRSSDAIREMREGFEDLSRSVLALVEVFGHAGAGDYHRMHCPMAFDDRGADWLQEGVTVANPYFGAAMLRCGELRRTFPGHGERDEPATGATEPGADAPPPDRPAPETQPKSEPEADPGSGEEVGAQETGLVDAVYDGYFALRKALAEDDLKAAHTALAALRSAQVDTEGEQVPPDLRAALAAVAKAVDAIGGEVAIDDLRRAFRPLTARVVALHRAAGHGSVGDPPFYRMHCPMAFDNEGADWLQREAELANPYFGAKMLRCGSIEGRLPAGPGGR